MKKRKKWLFVGVFVLIAVFVIPEVYAYFTKQNYESEVIAEDERPEGYETATLAGGCFWCMEPPFEKLKGVSEVVSGYTGGRTENPTYKEVSSGNTGHIEAVQVYYDPDVLTYEQILEVYWRQINPTDDGGQFVDRGEQYTTAIFYHSDEQKQIAETSRESLDESGGFDQPIVTPIRKAETFYKAEEYHQDYYEKNTFRYKIYRGNSGRDDYLEKVWGEDRKTNLPEK
ncbi:peptide-methionine (S)-S-oxide reductase MsrA [Halobacillus yeomjeoni]|uniref:Peptide methionine sulfoxide reductase MsrA n=1 Tax=Halobacillus yeomjeoni TaxID=311194 RepID=A0A931MVL6_9BACI|nr:peptide-methionine (S)-S-oxide reductase MsrA [Halobacillus yeomjeoni]MBH0231178.1 peptide-methionine (S)-S-oxide reductase MsrA [Halobacillus yeomjeoni]